MTHTLKDDGGLVHLDPVVLAEIARASFKKRLDGTDDPISDQGTDSGMDVNETEDIAGKVSIQELEKILKLMKDGKTKDKHGLCYELIKYGGPKLKSYLLSWLNDAVSGGGISKTLNQGTVENESRDPI